jgi:hypothetical protein
MVPLIIFLTGKRRSSPYSLNRGKTVQWPKPGRQENKKKLLAKGKLQAL